MISVQSTPLTAEELLILQNQALEILAKCNPKPVIAFDLDYTIWPTNCYEQTMPPYYPSNPRSMSPGVEDRVFCHNPKEPSEVIPLQMYPQARGILDFCASNNIVITVVSRSPSAQFVQSILEAFGIWDWFLFPQVFYTRTKTYHFRNLVDVTHFEFSDFLLFDDETANVKSCGAIGVNCCLVDKWVGLTWDTFLRGLAVYRDNVNKRGSLPSRSINGDHSNNEERSDHTVPYNHQTSGGGVTYSQTNLTYPNHSHSHSPAAVAQEGSTMMSVDTSLGTTLRLPPLLPSNSNPKLISPRTPVGDNRDIVLMAVDIQRIVSNHHARSLSRPGSATSHSRSVDSPKIGTGIGYSTGLLVINPPSPMPGLAPTVSVGAAHSDMMPAIEAVTAIERGDSLKIPTPRHGNSGNSNSHSNQGSRRNSAVQTIAITTSAGSALPQPQAEESTVMDES